jgi:hypothetical protein
MKLAETVMQLKFDGVDGDLLSSYLGRGTSDEAKKSLDGG